MKPLFSAGDTVFTSKPWIYTALPRLFGQVCYRCLKVLQSSMEPLDISKPGTPCVHCTIPLYCSERCKDMDWRFSEAVDEATGVVEDGPSVGRHQRECAAFTSLGSREEAMKLPSDFFLMIHAVKRLERDEAGDVDACSPPTQRSFHSLLSHSQDIQNDVDRLSVFQAVKAKVVGCLGTETLVDEALLLRIYGCLQINCFCIRDPFLMETGEGLYLGPSIIDHTCERNATFLFSGTSIIIKAISDIEALEKVRISYTELFVPTCVRKRRFNKSYYFDCHCRLCDGSTFADSFALRCDDVRCWAAIPCDERAILPCLKCGKNPACTQDKVDQSILLMRRYLEGVEENDDRITISEWALTEILEDFDVTKARCDKFLHPDNMLMGMVQDRRGRLLANVGRYDEAFSSFKSSLPSIRKFFCAKDIKTSVQLLRSGLSAFLIASYSDAILFLSEAMDVLGMCDGVERPMFILTSKLLNRSRKPDESDVDLTDCDYYILAKSLLSLLSNVRMEDKFLDTERLILPLIHGKPSNFVT